MSWMDFFIASKRNSPSSPQWRRSLSICIAQVTCQYVINGEKSASILHLPYYRIKHTLPYTITFTYICVYTNTAKYSEEWFSIKWIASNTKPQFEMFRHSQNPMFVCKTLMHAHSRFWIFSLYESTSSMYLYIIKNCMLIETYQQ